MSRYADLLLLAVIAINIYIVSSSRLRARVYGCALQGVVHGLLPFALGGAALAETPGGALHLAFAVGGTLVLKAVVIPIFMLRAVRDSGTRREAAPQASLHLPLLIAVGLVILSFAVGTALRPLARGPDSLAFPAGLSTLLIGLLLTVSGSTELTQIIGYQVTQNGVFVLGQTLLGELPLLVELGVLLDVLAAVMLTGLFVVQFVAKTSGADVRAPDVEAGGSR